MIELEGVPELVDPVMVAAFEGWNDAGDAASTAVGHMEREWKGEVFAALDAEDYYDFQVNRPQVWLDGGSRKITWPTTRLAVVRVDNAGGKGKPRDLVLVRGIEPSMRWRSFCNEILGFAHELGVEMVVVLGALLGDTPHSRPVPVTGVTSDPDLARTMNLEESRYEGPTGIVGILQEACAHAGVPAVSLWASVPHYVSQPPNPKATLALLNRLEDLLELNVPLGELQEDARAWQLGVDQLAAEDSEVAEYVQSLEEARDTAELPEASGEAIAKEFERYLRRRDGGGSASGGNSRGSGPGSGTATGTGLGDAPKRGTSGGRSRPSKRPSGEEGTGSRRDEDGETGSETKSPDEKGPDEKGPDQKGPDQKDGDEKGRQDKGPEDTGPDADGSEAGSGSGSGKAKGARKKTRGGGDAGESGEAANGEAGEGGSAEETSEEKKSAGTAKRAPAKKTAKKSPAKRTGTGKTGTRKTGSTRTGKSADSARSSGGSRSSGRSGKTSGKNGEQDEEQQEGKPAEPEPSAPENGEAETSGPEGGTGPSRNGSTSENDGAKSGKGRVKRKDGDSGKGDEPGGNSGKGGDSGKE